MVYMWLTSSPELKGISFQNNKSTVKKKKKVRRANRDQSYSSLYLCGNTPKNCLAVLYDFMFFFFSC